MLKLPTSSPPVLPFQPFTGCDNFISLSYTDTLNPPGGGASHPGGDCGDGLISLNTLFVQEARLGMALPPIEGHHMAGHIQVQARGRPGLGSLQQS